MTATTTSGSTTASPMLSFHATKLLVTAHGPQLFDVTFDVRQGSVLAIYGVSGAGKTTILRMLAGLTPPETGCIKMGDETWLDSSRRINVPTRERSIGFVFQDFALFPNLTVRQQLEFALSRGADGSIVGELLELMELEELQHQRPALLSGGQQQRIAIARAIARRPRLLLLDEPLSALDEEMRRKLQDYLVRIQEHYRLTIVLVSHYLPEIFRLADTVICVDRGRIVKQGAPAEVFAGDGDGENGFAGGVNGGDLNAAPFRITGIVLDITASGDGFVVRVRCGDGVIAFNATAEQAEGLREGSPIFIHLSR